LNHPTQVSLRDSCDAVARYVNQVDLVHHPLYFCILRAFLDVWGNISALAMRLPSVAFNLLALPFLNLSCRVILPAHNHHREPRR
jgi:hypothetical protein